MWVAVVPVAITRSGRTGRTVPTGTALKVTVPPDLVLITNQDSRESRPRDRGVKHGSIQHPAREDRNDDSLKR